MPSESVSTDYREFQRCLTADAVEEFSTILTEEAIPFQLSRITQTSDVSALRSGHEDTVVILIPENQMDAAALAVQSAFAEIDLPGDHPLRQCSDRELADIMTSPGTWDLFSLAHARRLLAERGVTADEIQQTAFEQNEHELALRAASGKLLFFGWIFSLGGGLIGMVMAWSFAYSTREMPDGTKALVYDQPTRTHGKIMLVVAVTVFLASVVAFTLKQVD